MARERAEQATPVDHARARVVHRRGPRGSAHARQWPMEGRPVRADDYAKEPLGFNQMDPLSLPLFPSLSDALTNPPLPADVL